VYLALGVTLSGNKELLGMWLSANEGAKFWLAVLTELQNRGVKDIFIACVDGLTGFPEATRSVYPREASAVVHGSPGESMLCAMSRTSTCKPWRPP
jgi:transposase-like protein